MFENSKSQILSIVFTFIADRRIAEDGEHFQMFEKSSNG